jgi:predicted house-cleaning noncanonical NTP pyrophosphatase (MazG superfamily)
VQHGKLVRDRIPDIIRSTGRIPEIRALKGDELVEALLSKLEEETLELRAASPSERIEELADILEVVEALAGKFGIDMAAVERAADAKRAERGGFDGGLWLVSQGT